jgi:hypothetical protein
MATLTADLDAARLRALLSRLDPRDEGHCAVPGCEHGESGATGRPDVESKAAA